jgi:predicted CXXCH cytochrome family protein
VALGCAESEPSTSEGRTRRAIGPIETAAFAGSASCAECHAEIAQRWRSSHHASAERAVDAELDRTAFDPPRTVFSGGASTTARASDRGLELLTTPSAGSPTTHGVVRVFGHVPLRQVLLPGERGRLQVSQVAFDPAQEEWFDVFGEDRRHPGDWGHWTGRGMTWNSRCADCHNTGVAVGYDRATDAFETRVVEHGVGCEACHGPAAEHVERRREGAADDASTLASLRAIGEARGMDACGACHSRRSRLTEAFRPGDPYLDHHLPRLPDETGMYYPDGQVRDENFVFVSFLGSRMHAKGVACGDCHEPHSGALVASGNALCATCHAADADRTAAHPGPPIDASHSHHPLGSSGDQCVGCHMPETIYMQRDARRDHGFGVPDPALTRELGIPNACNRCHAERTPEWAAKRVDAWYGSRRLEERRARTRAFAQARRGDRSAIGPLLQTAQHDPSPLWRAAATGLLGRIPAPMTLQALTGAADDPEPLVRTAAARALSYLVPVGHPEIERRLRDLLRDPVRAVRVEAGRGLRSHYDPDHPSVADFRALLALHMDQPATRAEYGAWLLDRDRAEEALVEQRLAVAWDPNAAAFRRAVAVTQATLGRTGEAIATLEAAVELSPDDPDVFYDLALAYAEAGRKADSIRALGAVVQRAPDFGRAWYNLGLALRDDGESERAMAALARAERLEPNSADAPYALALILREAGREDEAREAALRAARVDRRHTGALNLLRALGPPPDWKPDDAPTDATE